MIELIKIKYVKLIFDSKKNNVFKYNLKQQMYKIEVKSKQY